MVYVIILLLYLAALIFVGKLASRGVSSSDDWAVAGRSLGVWSSAASYFTTVLSAVSFIGYMGYYYQFGWGGWWNWAGTLICTILFAGFFAARLRRFGGVTISDFLDRRFGKAHGAIAAVLILFSTVLFTMAQLVASASIIKVITGIPEYLSVIIVGIVFLAFTVTGGMKSVAWTSVLTSVLILFGAYTLMIAILGKTSGFWELHRLAYTEDPALLDPFAGGSIGAGLALSWCVTWGIGNFGLPQLITKFNSCKDEKTARYSQGISGILFVLFYLPLMVIGLGMRILRPGIVQTDTVASIAMVEMVSPLIGGIVLAAILGAAISTAASVLLQAGTTATRDIYQKFINPNAEGERVLAISKGTTLTVGIISIVLSLFNSSTVLMIQSNMVGVLGSMLAMTIIIGFTWKRSNAQGGMAGMLAGILTAVIWYVLKQPFGWMPILPAIFTSTAANILVSLMTPAPPKETVDEFFGKKDRIEEEPEKKFADAAGTGGKTCGQM